MSVSGQIRSSALRAVRQVTSHLRSRARIDIPARRSRWIAAYTAPQWTHDSLRVGPPVNWPETVEWEEGSDLTDRGR